MGREQRKFQRLSAYVELSTEGSTLKRHLWSLAETSIALCIVSRNKTFKDVAVYYDNFFF
jgi:hypothetical protein